MATNVRVGCAATDEAGPDPGGFGRVERAL